MADVQADICDLTTHHNADPYDDQYIRACANAVLSLGEEGVLVLKNFGLDNPAAAAAAVSWREWFWQGMGRCNNKRRRTTTTDDSSSSSTTTTTSSSSSSTTTTTTTTSSSGSSGSSSSASAATVGVGAVKVMRRRGGGQHSPRVTGHSRAGAAG